MPYRIGRVARRYTPDFLVRLDIGGGEIVTLVLETKGYRGLDAQLKADAMRTLWVPGVRNGMRITLTEAQRRRLADTGAIEIGEAQLVWRGKDTQGWSDLIVPTPPLYIQERSTRR